jgi:hypothetical protein
VLNLDHALAVVATLQIGVVEGERSLVQDAHTVSCLLLWSRLACKQKLKINFMTDFNFTLLPELVLLLRQIFNFFLLIINLILSKIVKGKGVGRQIFQDGHYARRVSVQLTRLNIRMYGCVQWLVIRIQSGQWIGIRNIEPDSVRTKRPIKAEDKLRRPSEN